MELLQRKQYLVGVTIIEGRGLSGKDSAGTSDPYVKIKCAGQVQQTSKKYEVNSATWNQSISFPGILMNQYELESFELNVELYDHNALLANELIGQYCIGLSTLYRNLNHEFYKVWVGLFHRDEPNVVTGYLQLSCFIIGPNERPPVHSQDEDFGNEDAAIDSDEDDESIARRIESIKRAQGIMQIGNPSKINKNFQMTVVVSKLEGLPKLDKPIMPFVSARVNGCVMITLPKRNGQFHAKLQFPIFYPILNDKITMRVWHKTGGMSGNIFIANIPEHPDAIDQFNITKIVSQDGRMKARWFNLYGAHPQKRSDKTKSLREGTEYLGRVLIAFNIVSHDRPQLQVQQGNPIKEPKALNYALWVDLYEFIDCDLVKEGDPIWMIISIGTYRTREKQIFEWKKEKKLWRFPACQVIEEKLEKEMSLPADVDQIPDVFIDVYTNKTFGGDVRVAYLRLKARDCFAVKPKPAWFRLKSPYNDTGAKRAGSIMASIQFTRIMNPELPPERMKKVKDKVQWYRFYYHIHHGFELANFLPESKLMTQTQIRISNYVKKKQVTMNQKKDGKKLKGKELLDAVSELKMTEFKPGRYPVWDCFNFIDVQLGDLSFETDLKLTLINQEKGAFGSTNLFTIGELAIPLQTLQIRCQKPQFFNVISTEGLFLGQLLCNFWLKEAEHPKKKKKSVYLTELWQQTEKEFRDGMTELCKVDLKMSILGIRNLLHKASEPKVIIAMSNDASKSEEIKIDEDLKKRLENVVEQRTRNPTFGKITDEASFKGITLYKEPLFWPYLTIQLKDNAREEALIKAFVAGCEQCFTTISLLDFAEAKDEEDEILPEHHILFARAHLRRNQDKLSIIQEQIDIDAHMNAFMGVDINMNNLISNDIDPGKPDTIDPNNIGKGPPTMRSSVMPNGMVMNQLNEAGNNPNKLRQGTMNLDLFALNKDLDRESIGFLAKMAGANDKGDNQAVVGQDSDKSEDDLEAMMGEFGGDVQEDILDTGIIIDKEEIEEFVVTIKHKKVEDSERSVKIEFKDLEMKEYMKKMIKMPENEKKKKDKIKIHMMDIRDSMEYLQQEKMNEQKFWGLLSLNEEETFDYGRDILKEGTYETDMVLPYTQFPLFTKTDWFKDSLHKPIVQVAGILRSGNLSGASLKAKLVMTLSKEDEDDDEEDDNKSTKTNKEHKEEEPPKKKQESSDNKAEMIVNICKEVFDTYPFDLLDKKMLKALSGDIQSYKVRVYLISAQNLTAVGTQLDLKSRLAGMTALCTANPYPALKVGDMPANPESKLIKEWKDRNESVDLNLNPKFFRIYELDAKFPEDWKLEVSIWNKAVVSFADSLIGTTIIDLENRLHSNLLYLNRNSLKITLDKYNIEQDDLKAKLPAEKDPKGKKKIKKKQKELKDKINQIKKEIKRTNAIEQMLIPVEFRELMHPNKTQAQGIVEMWTEIYTPEEARKIGVQKMQTISKEVYEIRCIVWETRQVPLVDGDKVDIWVRVTFDPTGRPEDCVEKRTDIHQNSKTGWGDFKWRFKFDLELPCEFPRLKFTIHDAGFITDEAIGEAQLNLKNTINKVEKEGIVEVPKTYIVCSHANKPDEERGVLMFSMTILLKEDANADPVGESWDEPNHSPFLKKPTAGRGLGEMMKSLGFNFNLDFSWNPFGKYLPFILCIFIVLCLLTGAMYLKMFGF